MGGSLAAALASLDVGTTDRLMRRRTTERRGYDTFASMFATSIFSRTSLCLRRPNFAAGEEAFKPEDRDPSHRPEETGPVKVWATAEALWPERLSAWELGGLPRPQTFVSAACHARPTDCISIRAALNFPFPVVKSADRSWR
jgi:hypothetical protein